MRRMRTIIHFPDMFRLLRAAPKVALCVLVLFLCDAPQAWSHPHSFVNCTISFVMDETGLVGCRQRWVLDVMTSVAVLDAISSDHDAVLSKKEQTAIADMTTTSLRDYHYFTVIRANGLSVPVTKITDFSSTLEENQLIYEFLVPCRIKADPEKSQDVKVAVYDASFYTFIMLATGNQEMIDPSLDPEFANRQAPARPEDYKRFAKAVGVSKFKGTIDVQGATKALNIVTRVEDAAEMAYFHKQIIPQAAVLTFGPK